MKNNNYKYILNNGKALKGINILGHEITLLSSGSDIVECLKLAECSIDVLNDSKEVDDLLADFVSGKDVRLTINIGNYVDWDGIISSEELELSEGTKPYILTLISKDGISGLNKKLK